ncbi:MAG: phosphotransferase [Kiritimatiellae bacterium]|nr:phosphotransferase [Kiritimatiellia bacterium]
MQMPTIAFLLGAGFGERLRPLTLSTPKPLIPIWNKPLLAHTLAHLEAWGVQEVYINTHWLPERMREFIASDSGKLKLHELFEPEILGTGGCLRALKPHLNGAPFWLVNGDIVFNADPQPLLDAFEKSGHFAAAWLEPKRGPRTVEVDYAGRITCWSSPTPGVDHTFTFTGVSLLSASIIDFLPQDKKMCSVVEAFNTAMFAGKFVSASIQKTAYWNDAGTLQAYLQVHKDAKKLPELAHYTTDAAILPSPILESVLNGLHWAIDDTIIIPLGRRGSQRTFWRLVNGKRAVIAIAYETEGRAENARYAVCAKLLAKANVPVPRVFLDQPNLLVLEDLGDDTLDRHAKAIRETLADAREIEDSSTCNCESGDSQHDACDHEGCTCHHDHETSSHASHCTCHQHECHIPQHPVLTKVMTCLAMFHQADTKDLPLEPAFDQALYDWEVGLYEAFVAPFPAEAKAELKQLQAILLAEPQVLVHRDFQSSNILWKKEEPYIIDFQGMRRGAALYDLASFLFDPYIDWGEDAISAALTAYATATKRDVHELKARLPYATVQRLIQAIGAFHRLASVGQPRFLAYVPIARTRAVAAAEAAHCPHLANALRG